MPCVAEVVNRSLKGDCTDFTNVAQRLPNSESWLICLQLKEEDGIKFHVRSTPFTFFKRYRRWKVLYFPLYKSKAGRNTKIFVPEIYEMFSPYPDINRSVVYSISF